MAAGREWLAWLVDAAVEVLAALAPPDASSRPASPAPAPAPAPPPVRWAASGHPECPQCGLRFTTVRALTFHRAPDGACLDPMTARRPRGGLIVSMVFTDDDGTPVWGWPRRLLDARPDDHDPRADDSPN